MFGTHVLSDKFLFQLPLHLSKLIFTHFKTNVKLMTIINYYVTSI